MAKKIKALRVVAKREGFRRIGRRFGGEPTDIPLTELKDDEIKALTSDPGLVCVETTVDAPEEAAAESK